MKGLLKSFLVRSTKQPQSDAKQPQRQAKLPWRDAKQTKRNSKCPQRLKTSQIKRQIQSLQSNRGLLQASNRYCIFFLSFCPSMNICPPPPIQKFLKPIPDGSFHLICSLSLEWQNGCLSQKVLSLSVPPLLFFFPALFCLTSKSREWSSSCQTLRHAQPCSHTTCDTQTSQDVRCCPTLWVGWWLSQDGNTTWNSSVAWSTTLGFPCLTASYPQPCIHPQPHSHHQVACVS